MLGIRWCWPLTLWFCLQLDAPLSLFRRVARQSLLSVGQTTWSKSRWHRFDQNNLKTILGQLHVRCSRPASSLNPCTVHANVLLVINRTCGAMQTDVSNRNIQTVLFLKLKYYTHICCVYSTRCITSLEKCFQNCDVYRYASDRPSVC
jgi:hypothetical protein